MIVKKWPNILDVQTVIENAKSTQAGLPDGRWVPARPMPYCSLSERFRAAWMVFTGKADALTWPGQ